MPYPAIDLTKVKTYSLSQRHSRVMVSDFYRPENSRIVLDTPEIRSVAQKMLEARRQNAPIIWMIGGHVVKRGLALLLVDFMKNGLITHLAGNGASTIHDFEIAFQGHTSEDVATSLEDGSFGMAEETGAWMNTAIQNGVKAGMGMGEALGAMMSEDSRFLYKENSLLYQAYHLKVPYTAHVAIGTDIIHQHPSVDFAASGWASGQDFKVFVKSVSRLEGGVFCNVGSAVIGPEVFLKSVSIVRNLGYPLKVFTTANFDLIPLGDYHKPLGDDVIDYYYRPRKNVINRPVSLGGQGFHITGDHRDTLPTLHAMLKEAQ